MVRLEGPPRGAVRRRLWGGAAHGDAAAATSARSSVWLLVSVRTPYYLHHRGAASLVRRRRWSTPAKPRPAISGRRPARRRGRHAVRGQRLRRSTCAVRPASPRRRPAARGCRNQCRSHPSRALRPDRLTLSSASRGSRGANARAVSSLSRPTLRQPRRRLASSIRRGGRRPREAPGGSSRDSGRKRPLVAHSSPKASKIRAWLAGPACWLTKPISGPTRCSSVLYYEEQGRAVGLDESLVW